MLKRVSLAVGRILHNTLAISLVPGLKPADPLGLAEIAVERRPRPLKKPLASCPLSQRGPTRDYYRRGKSLT
jgi:hypothetical protein